jgi:hypothetical protein
MDGTDERIDDIDGYAHDHDDYVAGCLTSNTTNEAAWI